MRKFVYTRDAFSVLAILGLILATKGFIFWWWLLALVIAFSIILVFGATKIRWNYFITSLHHGDRKVKNIALSFDDGPADFSSAILDILRNEKVSAAFFCIGKRAEEQPEIIQRYDAEGHLVGNHSFFHKNNFDLQNRIEMLGEMQMTNEAIERCIGKVPRLFRPPFGVTNPELSKALDRSFMTSIGWSLRSFDTSLKDPEKLLNRLLGKVQNSDIILLHDSVENTASVLAKFIQTCRQRGFTFVRLDELLNLKPYE
ncbi:MAG: polysaccharide deacetylase family protein [Chitinophagaceae bacterium]